MACHHLVMDCNGAQWGVLSDESSHNGWMKCNDEYGKYSSNTTIQCNRYILQAGYAPKTDWGGNASGGAVCTTLDKRITRGTERSKCRGSVETTIANVIRGICMQFRGEQGGLSLTFKSQSSWAVFMQQLTALAVIILFVYI